MVTADNESRSDPEMIAGSAVDEEKFLMPYHITPQSNASNEISYKNYIPVAILTMSVFEIFFYAISTDTLQKYLRFEPNKLIELWRFGTYMLLHEDAQHLVLNVIMQILFASSLELRHGGLRVLILYMAGGITGVLGASCIYPDLVIGASGGVYALLISHVADILVNFENMNYKIYRCTCIVIIVAFDIAYNLVHILSKEHPLISWGVHVVAGLTGLFLGLVVFKCKKSTNFRWRIILIYVGLLMYIILLVSLITLTIQIRKCTPSRIIQTHYIYSC